MKTFYIERKHTPRVGRQIQRQVNHGCHTAGREWKKKVVSFRDGGATRLSRFSRETGKRLRGRRAFVVRRQAQSSRGLKGLEKTHPSFSARFQFFLSRIPQARKRNPLCDVVVYIARKTAPSPPFAHLQESIYFSTTRYIGRVIRFIDRRRRESRATQLVFSLLSKKSRYATIVVFEKNIAQDALRYLESIVTGNCF